MHPAFYLLLLVPVALVILVIWIRKRKQAIVAQTMAEFSEVEIVGATEAANFFGIESKGKGQIRGNGILILTKDKLCFRMYTPIRSVDIFVDRISIVETARSHLGKAIPKPLLKVTFFDENDQKDSVAWYVPNVDAWIKSIDHVASRRG